ncbi:nuclear apoptosis-inducing factor 1 isoform X2 [Cynoglossus semilaevis]|uniref:Zgc:153990 n=1 Tax=Cynoglossus semilaevis TaxID=244447 RepID=A0A3P8WJY6_CYNSE|nr:nuclear apoptosis-inducing factor 1-like isoform X2 [Cynoglossus semilaevis]
MSSSSLYYGIDHIRFKKRKARFSFNEVHKLLEEVRKNRRILVGKYNRGVPTEIKKMTWTEITAQVNEIGECHREVMEVVKKWSDLKCDTKRKVAAMQSGNMLSRGFNSRISRDLNHTERLVLQILEMDDDDKGMSEYGPLVDDDDGAEIEEEVEEDTMEQQNSPNGDMGSMPPPTSVTTRKQSGESSNVSFDVQYEVPPTEENEAAFGDSDSDQKDYSLPSIHSVNSTKDHQGSNGLQKQGQPQTAREASASIASHQPSSNSMLHNATLSLQEQHATNMLLETVSRSLELLSESVQQLAETQHEFVRESLQLQRDMVQVLRDFTGGAIAVMHDKLNGRPTL